MLSRLRGRAEEDGAVAIVALLCTLLAFAFAAVAVDLASAVARKGDTQTQADLAALAGAPHLPAQKTATDESVVAVADYLNSNQTSDDRLLTGDPSTPACRTSQTCITPVQLVNGVDVDGEVHLPRSDEMRVVSPETQVHFRFAGIFDLFGGSAAQKVDVASEATVRAGTPDGYGVFPLYVANPTAGNIGCDYGLQTLTDPPSGHVVPASVPTLYADADTNQSTLTGLQAYDGVPSAAVSSIAKDSTTGTITVDGTFKNVVKVGFFPSDGGTVVEVSSTSPEWVGPPAPAALPYTSNNGSITVGVPTSVTAVDTLWYVRVYQGATGGAGAASSNKWSAKTHAQPLSIGDAPYECVGGSSEGNFGTLKLPRSIINAQNGSGWVARNIATGLEPPLSLAEYPPMASWQCPPGPPSVVSTQSSLRPGTNCLETDTGMTFAQATPGFITGYGSSGSPGGYQGLLNTGSSSADPDGSGGCSRDGDTDPIQPPLGGQHLNDDLLTCFLTDTTTQLGTVARRSYAGPAVFSPAIYQSPRFAWVPVFVQETLQGGSNRYSIKEFRPAFITDQPMTATKGNGLHNSGTENGLGTSGNGGGFRLETLKVVFLNKNALPDADSSAPLGPTLGPAYPVGVRLVD